MGIDNRAPRTTRTPPRHVSRRFPLRMAARARFPSARKVLTTFMAMLAVLWLPTPIRVRVVMTGLVAIADVIRIHTCLSYTSPSPRD